MLYKWHAVAAQTARCCAAEKYYRYRTITILGPTEGSGTEDKSFVEA